jgi:hypothetical protein
MRFMHRSARTLAAMACVASLTSCTLGGSTGSAARQPIDDALAEVASAVATAQIAVDLLATGGAPAPVVDTVLLDQLHVLDGASFALVTVIPADARAIRWRATAVEATSSAQVAIANARAWANSGAATGTGAAEIAATLDAVADHVEATTAVIDGQT